MALTRIQMKWNTYTVAFVFQDCKFQFQFQFRFQLGESTHYQKYLKVFTVNLDVFAIAIFAFPFLRKKKDRRSFGSSWYQKR